MEKLQIQNPAHLKNVTLGSKIVLLFGEKSIVEVTYISARELLLRCLDDGYAMYWVESSPVYVYLKVEKL